MKKKKTATAKVFAFTQRKKVDGTVPLYLNLTFERKRKPISLKFSVDESAFNFDTNRYKKNREGNIKINAIEEKAFNIIRDLGENFSFHSFEEKIFGANVQSFTVAEYIDHIAQSFYKQGKRGTGDVYMNTKTTFIKFKGKNIAFPDITPKFLEKWENHLKKTCGTTTISIHMRTLRAAYNGAIDDKITSIDLYPFFNNAGKGYGKKGYSIKNKKTKSKFALSKADMIKIINYPTKPKTRLRKSIDYFSFSYLCRGINFKDMCYLQWNNVNNDRLTYVRKKTETTNAEEKEISIKLSDRAAEIIAQYSANDPYIFPILEPNISDKTAKSRMKGALKKINKDIRQVAEELQISRSEEIVFMVARHTFSSVLNDVGINLTEISEALGHSSIKTTENYIHSLKTRLDENDEHLL